MLNVTKTLLKKSFKEKSLAAIYIDFDKVNYTSIDADVKGSIGQAFVNAEKLRHSLHKAQIENIWVASPINEGTLSNKIYNQAPFALDDYNKKYENQNCSFHIVSPTNNDLVFTKKTSDAFQNAALGSHVKDKAIKTVIMLGVDALDCFDASIEGAIKSNPQLNIVVVLNGTNLENKYKTDQTYNTDFLYATKYKDIDDYVEGKEHSSRIHYAYTDEIISLISTPEIN